MMGPPDNKMDSTATYHYHPSSTATYSPEMTHYVLIEGTVPQPLPDPQDCAEKQPYLFWEEANRLLLQELRQSQRRLDRSNRPNRNNPQGNRVNHRRLNLDHRRQMQPRATRPLRPSVS